MVVSVKAAYILYNVHVYGWDNSAPSICTLVLSYYISKYYKQVEVPLLSSPCMQLLHYGKLKVLKLILLSQYLHLLHTTVLGITDKVIFHWLLSSKSSFKTGWVPSCLAYFRLLVTKSISKTTLT